MAWWVPFEKPRFVMLIPCSSNMTALVPSDFSQSFGAKHPIALYRLPPSHFREVFRCAPKKVEIGHQPVTAFADAVSLVAQLGPLRAA